MPNTLTKAENFDGRILGYTAIGIDAGASNYAVTTTMTTVDADTKVTFTAPPCEGISKSFLNGDWDIVNEKINPTYGRWCAKVLKEGQISIGDVIEIDT